MTASLTYLPSQYQAETTLVFLVEGTEVAYTNHPTPATIKALWSATGHGAMSASWKGGLVVDGSIKTKISPYDPKVEAETLTIKCHDVDDSLLALTQREVYAAGNRTSLRSAIDADDTSIPVQRTTGFASSGAVYIGHERLTYTSVTGGGSPTFNTATRGTLALFDRSSGGDFAYSHGVGTDIIDGSSAAEVTDYPRIWLNRRCGLYLMHKEGTTWSDGAAPLLLWAGRIKSISEDGTGWISFTTTNIIEALDTAVFSNQFEADLLPGIFIPRPGVMKVYGIEVDASPTDRDSGRATVTAAGISTHHAVASEIDEQLSTWDGAGTVLFATGWSLRLQSIDGVGPRYQFKAKSANLYVLKVLMSAHLWHVLGWPQEAGTTEWDGVLMAEYDMDYDTTTDTYVLTAPGPPLLAYAEIGTGSTLQYTNGKGTWVTQSNVPGPFDVGGGSTTNGFAAIGGQVFAVAHSAGILGITHANLGPMNGPLGGAVHEYGPKIVIAIPDDAGNVPVRVRQVFVEQGDVATITLRLLLSTGTSAYNDATYDVHTASGFGVGMPYSLVDVNSFKGLQGRIHTLILDKPRRFSDLLQRILEVGGGYLVWRRGKIAVARPGEPAFGLGTYSLNESNKARPEKDTYVRGADSVINQVKIKYNRTVDGSYRGDFTVRALRSISDFGERRAVTIEADGVYDGMLGVPSGLDEAIATAAAALSYFSRPLCVVTRSYDFSLMGMASGDTANLTSEYVPDPTTGTRGVTTWPCWLLSTEWDPQTGQGTCKVGFLPEFAATQRTLWAPSGEVSSASVGGGKLILNLQAHKYTPSSATATDASHFPAGYKVAIRSISETSGVGTTYVGTIESISGTNQLTLTTDPTAGAGLNTTTDRWIVEFDDYATSITAQKNGFAYIADSLVRIILAGGTDIYKTWLPEVEWENETVDYTVLHRRITNVADDDGEPHSVGWYVDAMHGINCEFAYGSRQQLVNEILDTARTVATSSNTWIYGPVWVPCYSFARSLQIGALGSCSGGGTLTIRFVASTSPPRGTSATSFTFADSGTTYGEITTTSATDAYFTTGTIANPNRTADGRTPGMWLTVLARASAGTGTIRGLSVYDSAL